MNKKALTTAMETSISDVLETMFFMPVDVMSAGNGEADPSPVAEDIIVRLRFSGPAGGCFVLQVPASLARDISADFMGIGQDTVTHEDMTGTMQEMINMLAGNTLSVYDPETVFDLSVPEILAPDQEGMGAVGDDDPIRLHLQTLANHMVMTAVIRD